MVINVYERYYKAEGREKGVARGAAIEALS